MHAQIMLPIALVLSAVHAAPSARTQCWTDEKCDDENVTVSCSSVTTYSPCSLSSACYCQSGNTYRCADLCHLGDRDGSDFCATVCPDFHRCISGKTVTAIALAVIESPASDSSSRSSIKASTTVPPAVVGYLALAIVPIAAVLGIILYRRQKHVIVPTQETHTNTALELRELRSGSASSGDGDIDPDSEALVAVDTAM